jgi:hypothetical protein
MANELVAAMEVSPALLKKIVTIGDLKALNEDERNDYYLAFCKSLGLNPLSRPFDFLEMRGEKAGETKVVMYLNADGAAQLRQIHQASITAIERETIDDGWMFVVTARASLPNGKIDESQAVIQLYKDEGVWEKVASGKSFFKKTGRLKLEGTDLANAMMKCETKAKRRVTLSICGISMPEPSETIDAGYAVVSVQPDKSEALPNVSFSEACLSTFRQSRDRLADALGETETEERKKAVGQEWIRTILGKDAASDDDLYAVAKAMAVKVTQLKNEADQELAS